MSVEVKILERRSLSGGHKLGIPGHTIRLPEPLARALVTRGEAEYVRASDADSMEDAKAAAKRSEYVRASDPDSMEDAKAAARRSIKKSKKSKKTNDSE